MLTALAAFSFAAWTYVAFAHGKFWHLPRRRRALPVTGVPVVAVLPARNEAEVVGRSVRSLLGQRLQPPLEIVLVDDGSVDGTAERAVAAAKDLGAESRLTVVPGRPLPPGWTGKLWAMEQGWRVALVGRPSYILFADADIYHQPMSIPTLLAEAMQDKVQLASFMVELSTETMAERWLIPAFVYFFFQLYPPNWTANPARRTAGAAGGCLLIETEMLSRLGGLSCIQSAMIDDCALAAAVKAKGGRLSLRATTLSRSLRSYGGFAGVGGMISRSAFYQLRHSYTLLAGTIAGLVFLYLVPPSVVLSPRKVANKWARSLGLAAWGLMSLTYLPMVQVYRRPWWQSLSLPLVSCFYAVATIHSAAAYARGRGGVWKGRSQDVQR